MTRVAISIASIAAVCFAGLARADTVQVNLGTFVNGDLTGYTGGSSYPQHGGSITVDGITFDLATIGSQNDTAIVQTNGTQDFSIPVDISGVSSVYVLVDSAFGSCGSTVGQIDFVGSSQTDVYKLTEGDNLRDHFNGQFCNTAGSVTGTANFGSDRLDMDAIKLPASFLHQTLESIDFKGFGNDPLGEPFLAALTLVNRTSLTDQTNLNGLADPAPVPEPSSLLFLGIACGAMLLFKRGL